MKVLALASNYEPIGVIPWTRAINLIFTNKVKTVEEYQHVIRSPSTTIKAPAVVVFKGPYNGKRKKNHVRFSRKSVWARDEGQCQYCFKEVPYVSFTIDHVIPKSAGGKTSWENVVTCCYTCNQKKSNKSLSDFDHKLTVVPKRPAKIAFFCEQSGLYNPDKVVPHEWKFYLER